MLIDKLQKTEDFEVLSADGERIRVRKTVTIDRLHDTPWTTYTAVLPRGIERPAMLVGRDRFKIARKDFKRLP